MRILVAVPDLHRLDFALWYALASIAQLLAVPPSFMKEDAAVLSPRPQGYITMKGGSFLCSKNFPGFRFFVGRVYERYYPNPYLYTRTRPDGDIGLAARDVLKRHRYAYPTTYFLLFFFSMLTCCSGGGCGIATPGIRFNSSDK